MTWFMFRGFTPTTFGTSIDRICECEPLTRKAQRLYWYVNNVR